MISALDIDTRPAKQPGHYAWLCCAHPKPKHLPAQQLVACESCGSVKLGDKVFTARQWACLVERVQ